MGKVLPSVIKHIDNQHPTIMMIWGPSKLVTFALQTPMHHLADDIIGRVASRLLLLRLQLMLQVCFRRSLHHEHL